MNTPHFSDFDYRGYVTQLEERVKALESAAKEVIKFKYDDKGRVIGYTKELPGA